MQLFHYGEAAFFMFFPMIWGCPSLRSGRAVRRLAVRSALRFFAALKSLVWRFAPPATIPQPIGWGSPSLGNGIAALSPPTMTEDKRALPFCC